MEDVFYILNELIRESASPLRTVEIDFAVDSSGFSTGTTVKWLHEKYSNPHIIDKPDWLKCHLICGVQINIVASVEVTDGNAGDSPYIKPLVQRTAQDFQISQVSADRAYLSAENFALLMTEAEQLLFRSKKTHDRITRRKTRFGARCITSFRCAGKNIWIITIDAQTSKLCFQ